MPTPCKVGCGNNAILKRPKTGDALCKECFFWAFETEIHHTIVKGKLFKSGDSVAIAASGGKDSTVLAHVLKLLNEKYSYGLNLMLLSIDEGITGYRDDSLDTVKQNKEDYEMNLKVLSYEELYGWTMDSIVREVGKKNNCTFCGVFRRQALDRGAAMLGVNVVATGHNADDIAETVIMNVLRGDVARLQRCTDAITASEGEGTIPRVKPLKYAYEKEIVMYAYFKQLVYFSTECIYSPNAYRGYARAFLKDLEKIRPTAILDIIHSGEELRLKSTVNLNERTTCSQCGFVSSQEICKACVLLEGLNRGLPKLGIGKSSKANKMRESLLIKRKKLHNMPIDYSKVRSQPLSVPPLEDVKNAISKGLKKNFSEVSVEVVDCPDLRAAPFNLASKGLGGKPTIVEVGGPPYLLPSVDREKVYDIKELVKRLPINPCFVIGAGAGPWPYLGKNAEMVANVCFDNDKVINKTYIAKVKDDGTSNITVSNLPENETRFALLANFFFCEGTPSKVLKIHCKNRTGTENFISAIRVSLEEEFKNDVIGLGGTFLLKEGKAKQHVMPDFSQTPLNSEADLNKWLNFYEMSAPLVACGTLVSKDIPGLDLRVQHFHSFSDHGEAGHYHEDTTPRQAEYLGYFTLGTSIHRFDQPVHTHAWGRD